MSKKLTNHDLLKVGMLLREATKKKQEKKFTTVVNYGGGSANFGV